MFINKIGYLIRQDRINRKLSLKTQSKLSNIFISTLSSIENDRNVNRVFLYRICNILKIDYEYMTRKKIGTNTIPFTYLKSLLFIV